MSLHSVRIVTVPNVRFSHCTCCLFALVSANHITCSGDVKGNIFCKEVTHLLQTANVYGDIISTAIKIEEGAVFCGNCKTEARFYADDELKTDQTKTNVKDEASDNKNIKN